MSAALTDRVLLETWAASRERPALQLTTELLRRAEGTAQAEAADRWPLARRNAALLELRVRRWGKGLSGVASCPRCETELEVDFDLEDLAELVGAVQPSGDGEPRISAGGFELRLPTPADLTAARTCATEARHALLDRCLVATPGGGELDAEAIALLEERLAAEDPVGAAELELRCPECGREWTQPLGFEAFLAAEVAAEARRIAAEVHALASAYGWSEAEVLEVSPERRGVYLELIE